MDEQLSQAIELFNKQEFFRCHEALEDAWRLESDRRRLFLQALIHLAVGFYHYERGNPVGCVRQLRKGISKLTAYTPSCEGVDTARLYREALAATEAVEGGNRLSTFPQIQLSSDPSSHPRTQP